MHCDNWNGSCSQKHDAVLFLDASAFRSPLYIKFKSSHPTHMETEGYCREYRKMQGYLTKFFVFKTRQTSRCPLSDSQSPTSEMNRFYFLLSNVFISLLIILSLALSPDSSNSAAAQVKQLVFASDLHHTF